MPEPVQRPVDIDKLQTGFAKLRSLRVYHFEAGSVIHGHAEEDEVLIVLMAGSVELIMIDNNSADTPQPIILSAASDSLDHPCAAYLPPHAAYQLIPRTAADVAYARATPSAGPPPKVFSSHAGPRGDIALLLEVATYPRLLRIRLMQIRATQHEMTLTPIEEAEDTCEALIHVRTVPAERVATITAANAGPIALDSWDAVSVMPGDRPTLRFATGSSALVLVVLAA